MHIKTYRQLTPNEIDQFYSWLKDIPNSSNDPASANMWNNNWEKHSNTLPYLLNNTNRFTDHNGEFYLLFDEKEIVACGGIYLSYFEPRIALAGVRTWVNRSYRNNSFLREFILPEQKKWAIENDCAVIALSFNEHNKNLKEIFKRNRIGEKVGRVSSRQPHHIFYKGFNEVEHAVMIQNTKQWVVYEQLDPGWSFDWTQIRSE
jgi:hypothetical protein